MKITVLSQQHTLFLLVSLLMLPLSSFAISSAETSQFTNNSDDKGLNIGKQDAITNALLDAEEFLDKNYKGLSSEQQEQFLAMLCSFIAEMIESGQLPASAQLLCNRSASCNQDSESQTIKIREKLYVLQSAKFFKDVDFKKNINMNNSLNADIGNVFKNDNSFIHNFGINNTHIGLNAGNFTMTGQANTSCGALSLPVNSDGLYNTGMGGGTLMANTTGSGNTACGTAALLSNISGNFNTSVGFISMIAHTSGDTNTAVGSQSLNAHTIGSDNVSVGSESLSQNITGSNNIAIGARSGNFLITGDNNIYIANNGMTSESGNIRIGTSGTHTAAFIQGIATSNVTGSAVFVDSFGQLGTVPSSIKFKQDIVDMNNASENIYNLHPVTFVYKNDQTNTIQYGLIAEEVAQVFPTLVVYDENGQPYTVQYQVLPVLLLNEAQKQQALIKDLAARVAVLETYITAA